MVYRQKGWSGFQMKSPTPNKMKSPIKQEVGPDAQERENLAKQLETLLQEDQMSDEEHEEYYEGTEFSRFTGDQARITRTDNPNYKEGVRDESDRPMTD